VQFGVRVDKATKLETDFANERTTLTTRATEAETKLKAITDKATKLEVDFANERKSRVKVILDDGVKRAVITQAERATWEQDFANEETFPAKLEAFSKLAPKMKTASEVNARGLGQRNSDERTRQTKVIDAVNEEMAAKKCDYDTAFANVKKTRGELFEGMKQPVAA